MPKSSGESIILDESAVKTAADAAKPAYAGWEILVCRQTLQHERRF